MAARRHPSRSRRRNAATLRIIGGRLRGSHIRYHGDPATRPMKDRVREATFNLLGPAVQGKPALDLFAGTGAMGLEAISRGATQVTAVERHFPTVRLIQENAAALSVADRLQVVAGDVFTWLKHDFVAPPQPLVVFCCPPYAFYVEQRDKMLELIAELVQRLAEGSLLVVESDERFDVRELPRAADWDVRCYPPAVISILELNKSPGGQSRQPDTDRR